MGRGKAKADAAAATKEHRAEVQHYSASIRPRPLVGEALAYPGGSGILGLPSQLGSTANRSRIDKSLPIFELTEVRYDG